MWIGESDFLDGRSACGDASFAVDDAAIFQHGDQVDVGQRRREDAAADGQDLTADADGFGEVSGDVGEGGEEEIAEIVADQAAAGFEAVLEQAAE